MTRPLKLILVSIPLLVAAGYSASTLIHSHQTATQGGTLDAAAITAGTLPIARGGTNGTSTPSLGAVAYGTGSALAWSAAPVTTGDCLKAATSGAPTWGACAAGGGYATVADEGTGLTQRTTLNFTGAGVSCVDNAGATRTDCTIAGGSGSPGGASGTVQYNNAGAFGGVTDVTSLGTALGWNTSAFPTTTAPGYSIPVYWRHVTGTPGSPAPPAVYDSTSRLDWHMLPLDTAGEPVWGCVLDPTFAATALTLHGWGGAGSATGTPTAKAWATTDFWTRSPAVQWASATTASSSAGVRSNIEMFNVGSAAGRGGFLVYGSFRVITTTANQRLFIGVKDATAVITATANPSAQLDTAYFGCDAGQTTLRRCTNDNVGTATCTDLGASFPCTTANATYNWFIWSPPGGGSVGFAIERTDSAATASATVTTDLPRNTVQLGWDLWINNGGTAAASTLQSTGLCYVMNP